jgi:GTP-binding protein
LDIIFKNKKEEGILFYDRVKITVAGGKGGDGCVSFRHEKFVDKGGPDGGNGGKGGDVIIEASGREGNLVAYIYKHHFLAQRGQHGQGKNRHGRAGEDLILKVPLGTMIKDATTGELIKDLIKEGMRVRVARGGEGGKGNTVFKSSIHRAPRFAEKGAPGEEREIILELKLIADVGLVGFPNVGKSTLLAKLSNAHPKIAPYPFTTLEPSLGVVKFKDFSFTVADIPGILEGAHKGIGLGNQFLRHIERTKVLLYVLDLKDITLDEPLKSYYIIHQEMEAYNPFLIKKPFLIVGNKMDLKEAKERLARLPRPLPFIPISALKGEGLGKLIEELAKVVKEAILKSEAKGMKEEKTELRVIYHPEFEIKKVGQKFIVIGKEIEKIVAMTPLENEEACQRLQRIFKRKGLERALKKEGIKAGMKVRIGEYEFEYRPE